MGSATLYAECSNTPVVAAGPDLAFSTARSALDHQAAILTVAERDIVTSTLRSVVAAARAARHRGVLVLRGAAPAELVEALAEAELHDVAWVGPHASGVERGDAERPRRIGLDEARRLLGAERDAVVLDLSARFHPDALGAVHGAVRAGGVLVLLTGPWPGRLGARAARILEAHVPATLAGWPPPPPPPRGTRDQAAAVDRLVRMIDAARPEPVALVADRGRGKSAALGIAAAHALARGLDVRVVAPHERAIEALVAFARAEVVNAPWDEPPEAAETIVERRLRYVGRRARHPEREAHALWLVDEAAALPIEVLRELARAPRVAFATTVHGYEGTGRGFTERFLGSLVAARRGTVVVPLAEPVRFAADDPLERLAFELLLLGAAPVDDACVRDASADTVRHALVDRDALVADERALEALFGLLVGAHYRTTPRDLATLLDAPHVDVHALYAHERPVAAALVAYEGGLDEEAIESLRRGRARPAGHALPETMVAHGRSPEAGRLRGARVVRIAVHPALQGRGLGGSLVRAFVRDAGTRGLDWVGALFGATRPLLAFWRREGFVPVRLSVSRGAATGEHSAAVLRACSPEATAVVARLRAAFAEDLPEQLGDPLRALDPALALAALEGAPWREPRLSGRELEQLVASAFGGLPYGVAQSAMRELVGAVVHAPSERLDDAGRHALVLKVLQRRPWEEVAEVLGLDGVPNAMRAVRNALRPLVLAHGGARAARLAASFD